MPTRRRMLLGVGATATLAGCVENIDAELNPNDEPSGDVFVVDSRFEIAPLTRASVTVRNRLDTSERVNVWARLYDDAESEIATESVRFTLPSESTSIVPIAFDLTGTDKTRVSSHAATITDLDEEPEFSDAPQFETPESTEDEGEEDGEGEEET